MFTIDNSALFRRFRRLLMRWSVLLIGSAVSAFSFVPFSGTKNVVVSFSVSTVDTLPDFAKIDYVGTQLEQALSSTFLGLAKVNKSNGILELNVSRFDSGVTVDLSGPDTKSLLLAQDLYVEAIKTVLANQINNQTQLLREDINKRLVASQKKLASLENQLGTLTDRGSALVTALILERDKQSSSIQSIQDEVLALNKFTLKPAVDIRETTIKSPTPEARSDFRSLAGAVMVVLLELGIIFVISIRRNRVFERADVEAFTDAPLIGLLPKEQFKTIFPQIRAVLNLAIAHRNTVDIVVIPIDNSAASSLALREFITDSTLSDIKIRVASTGIDGITAIEPGCIIVLIATYGHTENVELQKVSYGVRLCSESVFGTIMVDVPNNAVRQAVKFLPSLKASS